MFAVAMVTDHLAVASISSGDFNSASHVHLISKVNLALKRAQESQAAYLATGKRSDLEDYEAACADADFSMDRLVREDSEVTTKLAHAQGLRQFVHAKLSEIGQMLATKPGEMKAAAIPAGDNDLARIRKLLGGLAQEESRDVSNGLEAAEVRSDFHRNLVLALAVINVLFLGGVTFCAFQIKKLHSIITICAWSKQVQYQGKWVSLEEYMISRFGIRITHGISDQEYEKWSTPEVAAETIANELRNSSPVPAVVEEKPKAAA
jgi:CHASE3 domain sensor protein